MPIINSLTSLPPWHYFPLDLTRLCYRAKIGTVLSTLHAPPVFLATKLKERQVRSERGKSKHSNQENPAWRSK